MRLLPLLVLAALALAGCSAPTDLAPAGTLAPLAFTSAVVLTTEGKGFEPSIVVAPDGMVVAAAAKSSRATQGRPADWVWYSKDGGATWSDMPSPGNVHRAMPGLEGDLAVDAKGRVYYMDTYLPDNSIHRWSPGPTWDWSRPIQGTLPPVDDRPFAAAHGDGHVYLLSNTAQSGERIQLFRSTDGGVTWSLPHPFAASVFCQVAASPADDKTVLVACANGQGEGTKLVAHLSTDAGATWATEEVATFDIGTGYLAPVPAIDAAGNLHVAWADERVDWSGLQDANWNGDAPGKLHLATRTGDNAWSVTDATPFPGRFGMLAASAGRAGTVGLSFYATRNTTVDDKTEWYAYALVTPDGGATWSLAQLDLAPMSVGSYPPRDMHDNAFGPDNALHVILQRDRPDLKRQPGDGIVADVLHVAEMVGPNLGP